MEKGDDAGSIVAINPKLQNAKEGKRERFLKIYNNLPETERPQVIVIVNKEPYSWRRVYDEVINETKLSKEMLKKMGALGIL